MHQPVMAQDTFQVTSTADASDDSPGDGVCDTDDSVGDGPCTLRAAIEEANSDTNRDKVEFSNIPTTNGFATISLNGELSVEEEINIAGETAPNYPSSSADGPIVKLDGSNISGTSADGIDFSSGGSDGSRIEGLAIVNMPDEGIDVFSNNVDIVNCFVGIDVDGETVQGNNTDPDSDAAGLKLSGDNGSVKQSLVSGNQGNGIMIEDASDDNNTVVNTIVGLDYDGDAAKGNGEAGIVVNGSGNLIGNAYATSPLFVDNGNVVSANGGTGIEVVGDNNDVRANEIGTTADGSTTSGTNGNSLENGSNGIHVLGDGNAIGEDDISADRNLISGNSGEGILIGESGGPADNTLIINNHIGVNASVDGVLPNSADGIDVIEGSGTTIDGNVVSGNEFDGIEISAVNSNTSQRTVITGNYVGTNSSGADLGNDSDGILIEANPASGSREVEIFNGNVVGHNGADGVRLDGDRHDIAGNYVGTNANGDDLGNGDRGIELNGGSSVSIGFNISVENDADDPNVVGNNTRSGIFISDAGNNEIQGNYIGTNSNEADLGNGGNGIAVSASSGNNANDNTVGYSENQAIPSDPSPASGESGNIIANNGESGVIIYGNGNPLNNSIRGNSVYGNANQGISLSGTNGNDNGDGDGGPNYGQNYPVITDVANCDDSSSPTTVDVTYKVRSNTGGADESQYPLKIDFYVADSETSGEGKTFIKSEEYQSGDALNSVGTVLETSDAKCDDFFVATVTDDRGNTSQFFSPSQQLPVELASFEAAQTGEDAVELSWTTASEQNNAGFEVQRRAVESTGSETTSKSGSWTTVGHLESKADGGTTTEAKTYRFTAEDLDIGTHEFRLKQTDLDGSTHIHDAVSVKLQMQEAVRLSAPAPNPVQHRASLSFAVREQAETTIRLYNTLGQQVRTVYRGTPTPGESQTARIETDGLASGVYFLRLQSGSQTETQRVTIVR